MCLKIFCSSISIDILEHNSHHLEFHQLYNHGLCMSSGSHHCCTLWRYFCLRSQKHNTGDRPRIPFYLYWQEGEKKPSFWFLIAFTVLFFIICFCSQFCSISVYTNEIHSTKAVQDAVLKLQELWAEELQSPLCIVGCCVQTRVTRANFAPSKG